MSVKPFPEAVPTSVGWAHPLTGEQLDSTKGIASPVAYYKPNAGEKSFIDPAGGTNDLIFAVVTGGKVRLSVHSKRTDITDINWDFGDSTTLANGGKNVVHTYARGGSDTPYTVTATVDYGVEGAPTSVDLTTTVTIPHA